MRYLAFLCFASAAIEWPGWYLDRAGVAAAGLGFLALSLPPRPRRIRRAPSLVAPPVTVEVDDDDDEGLGPTAARVAAHLAVGRGGA